VVPRFFAPSATTSGSLVELPEDEAVHLLRVLRLRDGASVQAFDGRGRQWRAMVEQAARRRASVRLLEEVTPAPEPGVRIALSVAVLKGDKMDEVVRDGVMMGATAIRPVMSARVETAGRLVSETRRSRWQRIALASVKQCGRAVVPDVLGATTLTALLDEPATRPRIALVEPGAAIRGARIADVPRSEDVELLVGPEGGWTREEAEQIAGACRLVTLGHQTLRADAVPLVAITALRVAWHDL
jgi:16S rRNA (uracil1498-N3)-methyltransferase